MVEVEVVAAAAAAVGRVDDQACIGCRAATPDLGIEVGSCCVRELGRKRVVSDNSAKKKCGDASVSRLEALPEELLIRVLCSVDHADLDQLVRVSNTIREAALMAKSLHFAYSTPPKSAAFRNSIDLEDSLADDDEIEHEPPCAPKRKARLRIDAMKMAALAVALFTDEGDDRRIGRRG